MKTGLTHYNLLQGHCSVLVAISAISNTVSDGHCNQTNQIQGKICINVSGFNLKDLGERS